MNAYFESLLKSNNMDKSQLILVEDKATMPASELLQQLHRDWDEDESSFSDHGLATTRTSCTSIDISARYKVGLEAEGDSGTMEDLNSSSYCSKVQ
ncbi:unnamed protein product [Cylindrotheca closterium]|uniref:Uncharacterized protein n=1 Tax=Cylindrotheca closterium TaxID=2856 RepID=A0AAD2FI15_9STRA|nr:unnamed protein product [Cylindrotheca closterium]